MKLKRWGYEGMSYIDGKPVPGSKSPYTVWLLANTNTVVGCDYQEINNAIRLYNRGLYKYVEFWPWFSHEVLNDEYDILGYDVLWNEHNVNMAKVLPIK